MTAVYTTHSNIARSCFDTFGIDENPKKVAIDDAIISTSTSARQIKVQVHNFLCYMHTWTCRRWSESFIFQRIFDKNIVKLLVSTSHLYGHQPPLQSCGMANIYKT